MRLHGPWLWIGLALLAAACGDSMQGPSGPDGAPCARGARAPCCFDDGDCAGSSGSRCYTATCVAQGEGRCEIPAPAGMCWTAADCAPSQTCLGARICPCGALCLIADEPGTCTPSTQASSQAEKKEPPAHNDTTRNDDVPVPVVLRESGLEMRGVELVYATPAP